MSKFVDFTVNDLIDELEKCSKEALICYLVRLMLIDHPDFYSDRMSLSSNLLRSEYNSYLSLMYLEKEFSS